MEANVWREFIQFLYRREILKVPRTFHSKVKACKEILRNDFSSIITTVFDFAINMSSVDFKIETGNKNLNDKLNSWKEKINDVFDGKIPAGIKELAKEYFKERWTSSLIVMHVSSWKEIDGILLPKKVWIMDASGIKVEGTSTLLADFKYLVKDEQKKDISLPLKGGDILVQKPFGRWSEKYPSPYFVRKGTLVNYLLKKVLKEKSGEFLDELIHLLILKRGSERMYLEGHENVGDPELTQISNNLKKALEQKKISGKKRVFATPWDTNIEDFMPDLKKIFTKAIYEEVDRDLLASLGLIEILEGVGTTRRESILNPKPFIREIYSAINDFSSLLESLMKLIVEKNKEKHRKYFEKVEIKVIAGTPRIGITELLDHFRSAYDSGQLSKRTYLDVLGQNLDVEIERRKHEKKEGIDEILYPHVIVNKEDTMYLPDFPKEKPKTEKEEKEKLEDRTGPEKENFKSKLEIAPYKNITVLLKKHPELKKYPEGAQRVFMNAFNSAWEQHKDKDEKIREQICFKIAWNALNMWLEKNK